MTRFGLTIGAAAAALWAGAAAGQATHTIVESPSVAWGPGPASLPPGARAAVLYGDPSKPELFVMRLSLPANYAIPPHTHPRPEIVTVMSGGFHLGMGSDGDPAKAQRLGPGAFVAMSPGMAHYAHTMEPTVVQISTTGPWSITYLNAADDPRNAAAGGGQTERGD